MSSKKEQELPAWYLMTGLPTGMSIGIIYFIYTNSISLQKAVIMLSIANIVTTIYAAFLFHVKGYQ